MNNSALRIEWDTDNKKEIEEAKAYYRKAKTEGRIVTDVENNVIEFFKPSLGGIVIKETELKEHEFSVRVYDETGDRRLIWDSSDPKQVKEAMKLFNDYISRGWRAYATCEKGVTRRRIHEFDIEHEEVSFEEKPFKMISKEFVESIKKTSKVEKIELRKKDFFSAFIKHFKKVELVPKTYPG